MLLNGDDKSIIANVIDPEEARVAIMEGGHLVELFAERMWDRQRAGEIYKARVDNILPGMNAAFVNLGEGRNAFLYLDDAKNIEVKPNGEVIVQVVKVARKGKGPRVTAKISLPGRYVVLIPGSREVGVSRRIYDADEKERLKDLARQLAPSDFGVIVRTAASGVDEEALKEEIEELVELWTEITNLAAKMPTPSLLYRDAGLLGRVLRDELDGNVSQIVVDDPKEYEQISDYVSRYAHDQGRPTVELYTRNVPIFEYYGIEKEISAALERKLWLPSGGFLVIDQTEAMTVIDVNTGKYV
ncbi:ribonuclease E/G, partial [Acetomicrobium flavidum]|uniref:ribonuclease E/G n=1 Tax=Acetomicrobium flavidum TaxID=49896 RepID=UPI002989A6C2